MKCDSAYFCGTLSTVLGSKRNCRAGWWRCWRVFDRRLVWVLSVGTQAILTGGLCGLPYVGIVPQIKRRPLASAYFRIHWPLNLTVIQHKAYVPLDTDCVIKKTQIITPEWQWLFWEGVLYSPSINFWAWESCTCICRDQFPTPRWNISIYVFTIHIFKLICICFKMQELYFLARFPYIGKKAKVVLRDHIAVCECGCLLIPLRINFLVPEPVT